MSLRDILGLADKSNQSNHPLWTLLGPGSRTAITAAQSRVNASLPPISSKDKTATSLRLLLCDTQNTLEGFSAQTQGLLKDFAHANAQMEETAKVLENGQASSTGDLKVMRKSLPFARRGATLRLYRSLESSNKLREII